MLDVHRRGRTLLRSLPVDNHCLDACAACNEPCLRDADALVGFCTECLEGCDPRTFVGYPEEWVMLGGGD